MWLCANGMFCGFCFNLWMTSKLETMNRAEGVVFVCVGVEGMSGGNSKKEWQREGGGALVVGRAVSWQESSWGGEGG